MEVDTSGCILLLVGLVFLAYLALWIILTPCLLGVHFVGFAVVTLGSLMVFEGYTHLLQYSPKLGLLAVEVRMAIIVLSQQNFGG